MNIYKNNCSHDQTKLIDLLTTVKSLYERLTKDVCQYAKVLVTFQDYYQRFDLNNAIMLRIMNKKLNKLLNLFYISIVNHLSVTTNVRGVGDKIIKPVKQEYGTTTTIKYQNICKLCSVCNGCSQEQIIKNNKSGECDKSGECRDFLKVQTTINVATYDNISIVANIDNDIIKGYILTIGKLSYHINNYSELKDLKKIIRVPKNNSDNDVPYEEIERVTTSSIDSLYEFIDEQIKILGDVEMVLVINIEYITKYIKKFQNM